MTRRTIIYLHPHFTLSGGAGTFVLETASRFCQQGHRVIVISIQANPTIINTYSPAIEFIDLGGPLTSSIWFWIHLPSTVRRIIKHLDAHPDALIFAQVFPANWWGFLFKWLRPSRSVVWMCQEPSAFIHSSAWIKSLPFSAAKAGLLLTRPLLKKLDVWLAHHINHVFCNSNFTYQQAKQVYGFPSHIMETLYLGVDQKTFRQLNKKRQNKLVVICRLTKFKHVDTILRALQLVNHHRSEPVMLSIIGDGEERHALEKLSTKLGLADQVFFHGHQANAQFLVNELNTARAFVQASVGEPFGLAPIEAMACGTPAIVSDSGGMTETVLDGKTGFHFRGGDATHLSQMICQLIDNPALFSQLSKQAVQRASFFTWEKALNQMDDVFKRLP